MIPAQRESLRHCLLEVAETNGSRFGLTADAFAVLVARFGFRVGADRVAEELQYLADKGLVVAVEKRISPEVEAWRISADGRDFVARLHE